MTDDERPATMTVEQGGALLGISRRSVYRAAASGHTPTIRLGQRILVATAMLRRMLGITSKHAAGSDASPHQSAIEQTVSMRAGR